MDDYSLSKYGRAFPDAGYGGRFLKWLYSEKPEPYNSFGNGAAMRVSPVAYAARDLSEVVKMAEAVTSVTHNHPEGIKGAKVVAVCIWMALHGRSKHDIECYAGRCYDLNFRLDDIRETYRFDETCQRSVPQAIVAFLESRSFEDAVRNAVSIGEDSDTLAAIAGSIAEAYYGMPENIEIEGLGFLPSRLKYAVKRFEKQFRV